MRVLGFWRGLPGLQRRLPRAQAEAPHLSDVAEGEAAQGFGFQLGPRRQLLQPVPVLVQLLRDGQVVLLPLLFPPFICERRKRVCLSCSTPRNASSALWSARFSRLLIGSGP